jgi:hypothetical protein
LQLREFHLRPSRNRTTQIPSSGRLPYPCVRVPHPRHKGHIKLAQKRLKISPGLPPRTPLDFISLYY